MAKWESAIIIVVLLIYLVTILFLFIRINDIEEKFNKQEKEEPQGLDDEAFFVKNLDLGETDQFRISELRDKRAYDTLIQTVLPFLQQSYLKNLQEADSYETAERIRGKIRLLQELPYLIKKVGEMDLSHDE